MPQVLYAGETELGTLIYKDVDWPRYYFHFQPTPAFEAFRGVLDVAGSNRATPENMAIADTLDLRVVNEDGTCIRLSCIFIDGDRAIIREGLIRTESRDESA